MTSRPIIYTASQPRSKDILQGWKEMMVGDGMLAYVLGGTCGGSANTTMKGFAATATNPASMTVNVGPGVMFSPAVMDLNPYSTLGSDTTHTITKSGINLDTLPIVFTAPTTQGQSQIFIVQGQVQTLDTNNSTLQYFDSENPGVVYNGPNNSGTAQPTLRADICKLSVVVGVAGTSPATPSVSQGWTGLWIITIPANATAVTQGMITRFPNARFLDLSLCDLQSGTGGGGGSGTVTSITAGTGLTGGTITTSGTIALASTGVTTGTYTNATVTVNAQGQITNISSGSGGGGGSGTVTSITAGGGLNGGTITTVGTISMPQVGASGSWTNANITVDAYGRVTSAANGSGGGTDYSGQISTINGQITSILNRLSADETAITNLQGNISTINGQITTLQGNVTSINTSIGSINGSITTINNQLQPQRIRYRLQSNLDIYINGSTGNDTTAAATMTGYNPSPSQSTPFRTLQSAWNSTINAYDVSGRTVTFHVADGTYTAGLTASGVTGLSDTGQILIIGNTTTWDNCFINVTGGNCFAFDDAIQVYVKGFKLAATMLNGDTTTGVCIAATSSKVTFDAINFGTSDNCHIIAYGGASIGPVIGSGVGTAGTYGYRVTGGASDSHIYVREGVAGSVQASVTISAGVTCGTWYKARAGTINTYQTQFNGTQANGHGQRYNIFANGILDNAGVDPDNGPNTGAAQFLPGDSNGSTASGGQKI